MEFRYYFGRFLLMIPIVRHKQFVYRILGVNEISRSKAEESYPMGPNHFIIDELTHKKNKKKDDKKCSYIIVNPVVVGDYHNLYMHDKSRINKSCFLLLRTRVEIGYNTGLAYGVTILTGADPQNGLNMLYVPKKAPVIIGHDCWIGARSVILPGVTIGDYCVVAAGSVVTKDVPSGTLVAGNPATIKKKLVIPGI